MYFLIKLWGGPGASRAAYQFFTYTLAGSALMLAGFVALSLNVKVHSMILVMFSQFLSPSLPLSSQVWQMTAVFLAVGLACHFFWIYGGQLLFSRLKTPRAMRIQGYVFGLCMLAVAVSMVL